MKILVIGLDCAAPELLFGDEELVNIRRLMAFGCYGKLESVIPPITVPAWMCMATSQDPGSLGIYGFRNRMDHTYAGLGITNSRSIPQLAMWDQVSREGQPVCVVGVPPGFPPRRVNGAWVGCFLTPDTSQGGYTYPEGLAAEITELVGEYPADVKGFRTDDKAWLLEQTYAMSRAHFAVVRHLMNSRPWEYFQFVEIGLDRMHHGFWKYHDPRHRQFEVGNPYQHAIRDYYRYLDEEIGSVLALLDEDTVVLVASDHGARALDGGFCVNEWLIQQGLLTLKSYPDTPTRFEQLDVDWAKTTAWSEGGYYARVFLNVKGREPEGSIDLADYERIHEELAAKLTALPDDIGQPMGTLVYTPEAIYRQVRNIPPDLIVHFGALAWRSIGSVGHRALYLQENDTGPDDCNHAQHGAFILAAPNSPLHGELQRVHLLDIAPTLLELGGYEPLPDAQGRSLVDGCAVTVHAGGYAED
ncbi:MAG TPA: alkaline phosphatase family protein, partial [Armatimonadota bacterium]